jgi:hypothetical protein
MPVSLGKGIFQYPFVAWERLKPAIVWKQGQHALTVGATNTGKSTVAGEFLPRRDQVVVCVSKGMDPIFEGPYYAGKEEPYNYEIIRTWKPGKYRRVILWPANQKTIRETDAHKQKVFSEMFDNILLVRGNWCIGVDEEHYMSDTLGLKREITNTLEQGRSAGISMWNNTQRPAGIPLATYVNSSHAFLFQSQEAYDLERLSKMANKHTNAKEMGANLDVLESFESHEFIYLDRTGRIPPVRSIVKKKGSRNDTKKR